SPDINPALPTTVTTSFGTTVPVVNSLGIVPIINLQGGTSITGPGIYNDYSKNHNIFGSWTHTWRQHANTVGASVNHYEKMENNTTANAGTFSFTGSNKPGTGGA